MPPELIPDDEDYASEEDSDFAPDAPAVVASDASSDEESEAEDAVKAKPKASTKRRRGQDEEAEDAGFENSGDEAIIERGLKRQKKKGKKGKDKVDGEEDGDSGGEGGLIKTRSMRAQEYISSILFMWMRIELILEQERGEKETFSRYERGHSRRGRVMGEHDLGEAQTSTRTYTGRAKR